MKALVRNFLRALTILTTIPLEVFAQPNQHDEVSPVRGSVDLTLSDAAKQSGI